MVQYGLFIGFCGPAEGLRDTVDIGSAVDPPPGIIQETKKTRILTLQTSPAPSEGGSLQLTGENHEHLLISLYFELN